MRKRASEIRLFALTAGIAALAGLFGSAAQAQQPVCSVWLVESSRFMNVPFGAFMPDRAFVPGSTSPRTTFHGRSAGQRRRHQVRQGIDPVRFRLEAAGLSSR